MAQSDLTPQTDSAGLSEAPISWHYLGSRQELARGPRRHDLPGGQRFVGFLTASGQPVVLAARCVHMGADLALGSVRGDRLACPLHGWEYGADGRCGHIPCLAAPKIPAEARQPTFPVAECGGQIFFFNAPEARFPMPFFENVTPEDLQPARAFDLEDNVPWYFIGANGFDLQHFDNAHDRVLIGQPTVDSPHPFARRITLDFKVSGDSWADRVSRRVAGAKVQWTVTSWCGSLIFVVARFQRITSYGLVTVQPLENLNSRERVIVWTRRSRSSLGRRFFDPVNAAIRRSFIQNFLRSDLGRMSGARYGLGPVLEIDNIVRDYMNWLRKVHR
ncbi:MAG: Rieske 2Fe-2S domain-containing protein [Verrucomicrobia bacterium]|nr:Rieske 2Fe-2S domain-containing protein [Verrucomicrobiota bacterium]